MHKLSRALLISGALLLLGAVLMDVGVFPDQETNHGRFDSDSECVSHALVVSHSDPAQLLDGLLGGHRSGRKRHVLRTVHRRLRFSGRDASVRIVRVASCDDGRTGEVVSFHDSGSATIYSTSRGNVLFSKKPSKGPAELSGFEILVPWRGRYVARLPKSMFAKFEQSAVLYDADVLVIRPFESGENIEYLVYDYVRQRMLTASIPLSMLPDDYGRTVEVPLVKAP